MSIHRLVFIHSGVKDAAVFYNTLPGVKAIIVKNDDTAHSLLLKMTDISELTHVSIVFVNDNNKAPFLPCTTNGLDVTTNTDKWIDKYKIRKPCEFYRSNLFFSDHFMLFILTLKSQYTTFTYLDIISCNIHHHEQFNTLLNQGITVRHSTNLTGKNGDWILESHDINVTPFYFTDNVRLYNYTLDAPTCINELVDLGTLSGNNSFAYGCSADGSIIVGQSNSAEGGDRAFRWTQVDGMISLGKLPGGNNYSSANGCSANGTIIVGVSGSNDGSNDGNKAFRWIGGVMTNLGTLAGGIVSNATGCSADGSVVVGVSGSSGGDRAFRWTTDGMISLGILPGGSISQASGCSADGSVIVGGSDSTDGFRAFRWTTDGMISLGTLPGGLNSSAYGCSADGSVIVGTSDSTDGLRAFLWTEGIMTSLGTLPGGSVSYGFGCSADGSTVVGLSDSTSVNTSAFKWTQETGMICLGTLGGNYSIAYGSSADGSVIVGYSQNTDGYNRAFRYQSPFIPPAPSESSPILPTPITFITPPVNPQTGDYDSSRLTNEKADKVIRVYTNTNESNARPVFPDYASYMRYINGALRF
jgi:probable HAF family extracellular repeat protein